MSSVIGCVAVRLPPLVARRLRQGFDPKGFENVVLVALALVTIDSDVVREPEKRTACFCRIVPPDHFDQFCRNGVRLDERERLRRQFA
jgi:hypothetical protein